MVRKPKTCPMCGIKYKDTDRLYEHIRDGHDSPIDFALCIWRLLLRSLNRRERKL